MFAVCFSIYSSSEFNCRDDLKLAPAASWLSLFLTLLMYKEARTTVRRMTDAEAAPRVTNMEGETLERRTDLVGTDLVLGSATSSSAGDSLILQTLFLLKLRTSGDFLLIEKLI